MARYGGVEAGIALPSLTDLLLQIGIPYWLVRP